MSKLNNKISIIFAILVTIFLCLSIGHSPIGALNHQDEVIFRSGNDFMADFFNLQRYIAERDPFFSEINGQSEHAYLPIAYLMLMPFNNLCDYAHMSLQDCWDSHISVFSAVLFLLLSLFFFFDSLYRLNRKKEWRTFNTFLLLFSSIFLFTIERGNLIILTVAGINYFLVFYDSESKWLQRLGLFCLCFAAALKIYPVLFGVLLLVEKRYKDIALCVLCGLILTFVPFLFFKHGLSNVPRLLENVRVSSEVYGAVTKYQFGIRPIVIVLTRKFGLSDSASSVFMVSSRIFTWLLALVSIVLSYVEKRKWLQVALLSLTIVLLPTNSFFYTGMYLIPFIILYINNNNSLSWEDYFIVLLLALIFNPIQIMHNSLNVSMLFANICCILLWGLLIYMAVANMCITKRKRL